MTVHIAYLTDQPLTETKREVRGHGITLVSGVPADSKTVQGMRYEFDVDAYTADAAQAWVTASGIQCAAWKLAESEAKRRRFWFEAARVGEWKAANDGTGKAGLVALTMEKLSAAVASVKKGARRIKNKLTHGNDQRLAYEMFGDMGDIVDARMRDDGVMELETDAPESVALAIEAGLIKQRSVEIDPTTNELIACAWLGKSQPAVKGLAAVALSEGDDIAPPAFVINGEVIELEAAEPASGSPGATDGTEPTPVETPPADTTDSEEEKKMSDELKARIAELEAANKREREGRVASFLASAVGKHINVADVEREKTIALSMPAEMLPQWEESIKARTVKDLTKTVGDTRPAEGATLPHRAQRLLQFAEDTKKAGRATDDGPVIVRSEAEAILMAEAEEIQKRTGMDYGAAWNEAGRMNPDLVKSWRDTHGLGKRQEV